MSKPLEFHSPRLSVETAKDIMKKAGISSKKLDINRNVITVEFWYYDLTLKILGRSLVEIVGGRRFPKILSEIVPVSEEGLKYFDSDGYKNMCADTVINVFTAQEREKNDHESRKMSRLKQKIEKLEKEAFTVRPGDKVFNSRKEADDFLRSRMKKS